jgi:hypothetical protein
MEGISGAKVIGSSLGLHEATVRKYLSSMYEVVDVRSDVELVVNVHEAVREAERGEPRPAEGPRFRLRERDERIVDTVGGQPLVGRQTELHWLTDFVKSATSGYALVVGPPGVGKTALLAKWLAGETADTSVHLCYHFLGGGQHSWEECLACLAEQLSAVFDPGGAIRPGRIGQPWEHEYIVHASLTQPHLGFRLVVIIDGLSASHTRLEGVFPQELADGTLVILSAAGMPDRETVSAYEDALGIAFTTHLSIRDLGQRDIADLMRARGLAQLAENTGLVARIKEKTGGLAIWVDCLVRQLADDKGGLPEDLERRIEEIPSEFATYVRRGARQIASLVSNGDAWFSALCHLAWAKGPLSSRELRDLALRRSNTPLPQAQLRLPPRAVIAWTHFWVERRGSDGDLVEMFDFHDAIREGWRSEASTEDRDNLLEYCRDWLSNNSLYALRHLPDHLRQDGHVEELYSLARGEDFLRAQETRLCDFLAPLTTIRHALQSATEVDGAARIAEFLIRHARQAERTRGVASLLSTLEAEGLERAWELCELRPLPEAALSYLLLACHLSRFDRRQDCDQTMERLVRKPLHSLGTHRYQAERWWKEWEENVALLLLSQVLSFSPDLTKRIAADLLTGEGQGAFAKVLALQGRFRDARHCTEALATREPGHAECAAAALRREAGVVVMGEHIDEDLRKGNEVLDEWVSGVLSELRLSEKEIWQIVDLYGVYEGLDSDGMVTILGPREGEFIAHAQELGMIWPETIHHAARILDRCGRHEKAREVRAMADLGVSRYNGYVLPGQVDEEKALRLAEEALAGRGEAEMLDAMSAIACKLGYAGLVEDAEEAIDLALCKSLRRARYAFEEFGLRFGACVEIGRRLSRLGQRAEAGWLLRLVAARLRRAEEESDPLHLWLVPLTPFFMPEFWSLSGQQIESVAAEYERGEGFPPDPHPPSLPEAAGLLAQKGRVREALSIADDERLAEAEILTLLSLVAEAAARAGKVAVIRGRARALAEKRRLIELEIGERREESRRRAEEYWADDRLDTLERENMRLTARLGAIAMGLARADQVDEALSLVEEARGPNLGAAYREIGGALARLGRNREGLSIAKELKDGLGLPLADRAWLLVGIAEVLIDAQRDGAIQILDDAWDSARVVADQGDAESLLAGPSLGPPTEEADPHHQAEIWRPSGMEPEPPEYWFPIGWGLVEGPRQAEPLFAALVRVFLAARREDAAVNVLEYSRSLLESPRFAKLQRLRCLPEIASKLALLGRNEQGLQLIEAIEEPDLRDACLAALARAYGEAGNLRAAQALIHRVGLEDQRRRLVFQLGEILARTRDKPGFEELLLLAAEDLATAYAYCPLIVELYEPQAITIETIVSGILDDDWRLDRTQSDV